MVRAWLGIKSSGKQRRSAQERSDPAHVSDFVRSWGGQTMHTDNLPAALQAAMAADGVFSPGVKRG